MPTDDHAMATDASTGAPEEPTQLTTQPEGTPNSQVDSHLWGFLQPCNSEVSRIDLFRVQPQATVGRNADNSVQLLGMKVSGRHCQISWDGADDRKSTVTIQDFSSNGTWVSALGVASGDACLI
jgi:ser/thr/tyr protein kinase RAD53